jgi:uncharacterized protein YdeI (YjbR/CyaY-like superfamily)
MKTLLVETPAQWRAWLSRHHAVESEVWLIFHKQHTGIASIDYMGALDEALCFGWVDSLIKRLDDRRYARKFTPRRPDSRWSDINRKRYAELKAEGRMRAPGLERPPTARGYDPPPQRLALPARLPAYIQAALKKNPAAERHFKALSPAHRRRYFAWIESARRQDTKERRLKEAISLLERGEELGLK